GDPQSGLARFIRWSAHQRAGSGHRHAGRSHTRPLCRRRVQRWRQPTWVGKSPRPWLHRRHERRQGTGELVVGAVYDRPHCQNREIAGGPRSASAAARSLKESTAPTVDDHMASQTEKMRGHTICEADVAPDVVDAGADVTLQAKVSCSPPCDLRGHALLVKDHAGADLRRVELTEFDGVTNRTREFVMKAPVKPGEYTWLAVSPAVVQEGV